MEELLASMSSRELSEWMAYFSLRQELEKTGGMSPADRFRQWAESRVAS